MPPKGMNGTPFSEACRAVWMAGQVLSRIFRLPSCTARVKLGAKPASPRLTAAASINRTQPAPISRSAAMPEIGTASTCRSLTPLRIRARINAMGTKL